MSSSSRTHVTFATFERVFSAYLYTMPTRTKQRQCALKAPLPRHRRICGQAQRTCIEHKRDALPRMEEDDRARIAAIVALKLDGRAIVRVVCEVKEDLVLRRARHAGSGVEGAWVSSGSGSAGWGQEDAGGVRRR